MDRKTSDFYWTFLARSSKLLSMCPEEHIQNIFFERKSWNFLFFGFSVKFLGQWQKKFCRFTKTVEIVPRNKLRKNFLESKKMQLLSRFWTNSLCHFFWRRSLAELSKLQSTSPWKFLKKNFFWCFVHCFKLVWTLPKKRALVEKFSSGLSQLPSARHSNNFEKKSFLFLYKLLFSLRLRNLSNFFVF